VPYYAGRFLPNFLALPLVILSFSTILRYTSGLRTPATKEYLSKALITLTFTATVIRLELAPLVAAVAIVLWVRGDLLLVDVLTAGATGGFGGLGKPRYHQTNTRLTPAATAVIDGYFYRLTDHQLSFWPELSAFMFNIPQGRAAEWGVMPPWYYLLALPKLLLTSLPLAAAYPYLRRASESNRLTQLLLVPSAVLIGALSLVGHKASRWPGVAARRADGRNGASSST
jgi:alpha-1,6-mannosyltransferase